MPASPSSGAFELAKDEEEEDAQVKVQAQDNNPEQISAADYDPSLDRREDEQKRVGIVKDERPPDVEIIEEEEEDDDVEDMFAVATSESKSKKVKKIVVSIFIV
jgi:serine/threonine-protein kinase PRP4